ncbi:UPF0058 family protein [Halobaculum magnesiiphilum]|uniref:UPF0058 family protein n=1 Tax=Halobaculum magnesiiphilum TaxID=1017351 RepID=A0A8T8WFE6_9EURY|nr:UPF0058 family protein [Halobaculum magnesiiphilum]QZP38579.1 UPF0058 family protein [Halobaculum magnesiiphilum]
MRKNELVHLHTLLRTAAGYLSARGDLPDDALDAYESHGVTPMSMRADRGDHEAAVTALATGLAATAADDGGADDDTTGGGEDDDGGSGNPSSDEASPRAVEGSPSGPSPE